MKRALLIPMVFAMGLAAHSARAAEYNLTGQWNYTTSNHWKKGVCPVGKDSTGTCRITQNGDDVILELLTGMVCSPASMCTFAGTVSGNAYTCSNSDTVDEEGGQATNTITFTASSMTEATGTDSSSYEHPKMTCEWGFDISLSRDADDVSEHTVSGQGDAGLDDADGDGGGCSVVAPTSRVHFSLIGILAYLFG